MKNHLIFDLHYFDSFLFQIFLLFYLDQIHFDLLLQMDIDINQIIEYYLIHL